MRPSTTPTPICSCVAPDSASLMLRLAATRLCRATRSRSPARQQLHQPTTATSTCTVGSHLSSGPCASLHTQQTCARLPADLNETRTGFPRRPRAAAPKCCAQERKLLAAKASAYKRQVKSPRANHAAFLTQHSRNTRRALSLAQHSRNTRKRVTCVTYYSYFMKLLQ